MTEDQIIENIERCPSFDGCSQNLCPLDYELHLRKGGERDKCRWMRNARKAKIKDKEFITGGRVMPNAELKFVPESNIEWLNEPSKKKWYEIHKRTNKR